MGERVGGVGEWMSGRPEWDGVLSRCICAMGGYGGMGLGGGHGHGGREREGEREVHAHVVYLSAWAHVHRQSVGMRAAQEEEKCLAADAGRLTHGRMGLTSEYVCTYCCSRIEYSNLRVSVCV